LNCIFFAIQKNQPPAAIGSSSDSVTSGGLKFFICLRTIAFYPFQNCRPLAAIGSSPTASRAAAKYHFTSTSLPAPAGHSQALL
jgi:hypothetical protein